MEGQTPAPRYRTRRVTRSHTSGSGSQTGASSLDPFAASSDRADTGGFYPQSTLETTEADRTIAPTLNPSQPSSVAISAPSEAEAWEMIEKIGRFPEPDQQEHWELHRSILRMYLKSYEAAEGKLITARNAPKSTRVRNDGVWCSDPSQDTWDLISRAMHAYMALVHGILNLQACAGINGIKTLPHICLAINWGAAQKIMAEKAKLWSGFAALIRNERLLPEIVRLGASGRVKAQPEHALGLRFVRMSPTNGQPEVISTIHIEQDVQASADANHEEPHDPTDF
ncbi:hypothetical protein HD553DRAFT_333647 [Filobasidium floriforme]|uniref:uncharacterized protein n=1 Tax=Filobasidium floriforme TaxID=5210 RepID=UPI001E8D1E4A|nr:uncharacterized protein HD553DRAFT_333647 [Filobasidium floriforme]KAH8089031.1 hypothetical protein HD553DRAFT_333647 [Filobasidium floriforme]